MWTVEGEPRLASVKNHPRTEPESMNRRDILATTAALFGFGSAGCFTPQGSEARIDFTGNISDSGNGTRIDGYVYASGSTERENYRNVSITFYAEDGTLLERDSLGTLPGGQGELFFNHSVLPEARAIVFESDDFWNEDMWYTTIATTLRKRSGDKLEQQVVMG